MCCGREDVGCEHSPHMDAMNDFSLHNSSSSSSSHSRKRSIDELSGTCNNKIVCIELCAGCAKLSATLFNFGFTVFPIDHSKNRHKQLIKTVSIDLAHPDCLRELLDMVGDPTCVFYLHAAPPCGTASRARERRIPFRLRKRGAPEPKPLRSEKFPHGLPSLKGLDKVKVEKANDIYKNVAEIISYFAKLGAGVTVENPRRSYMWSTKWFKTLIGELHLHPVHFQQCMHGGRRDKWTTFYTNSSAFDVLALECDRSHPHLAWGVSQSTAGWIFSTASEAEYPQELCTAVAKIVKSLAIDVQISFPATKTSKSKPLQSKIRASQAGLQPRGNLLPPIISEFKDIINIEWCTKLPTKNQPVPVDIQQQYNLPPTCKFLTVKKGKSMSNNNALSNNDEVSQVSIGVFRTPDQFLEEAKSVQHPFDDCSTVSDDAKRAIFALLTEGVQGVSDAREAAFQYYEQLEGMLESHERAIHQSMDKDREALVCNKRFLLFHHMCIDAGIEDEGLLDLMVNGVKLTGMGESTGLFPEEVISPAISDIQLMRSSRWNRKALMGKSYDATSRVSEAIWEAALDEEAKGWLSGPFTEETLKEKLGPLFVVSRRFGLDQGEKIRAIDDMSESRVNSAYGSSYRLDLPGVDGVSVLARTFVGATLDDRSVSLKLSDGSLLVGVLHESLTVEDARKLQGRTLDLEAAYKQMLTSKSSLWASVLAIDRPGSAKSLFISNVLPFGASASVYAFNKIARAIHTIGERLFSLVWSNYYDDYPQVDLKVSNNAAQDTAERLLGLLGWQYSMKPAKRQHMCEKFDALGVTFDFTKTSEGEVVVRNKASRIEQLCEEVDKILGTGVLPSGRASTLRGKLQFTESHTYGRVMAANLKFLHARASGKLTNSDVPPEMQNELRWVRSFLVDDCPRILRVDHSAERFLIFTDAALECCDTKGTLGMVAYHVKDGSIVRKWYSSDSVPDNCLTLLQDRTVKIISTLELAAAVMSVESLKREMFARRVFLYVDNEAARASLISRYSRIPCHNNMLKAFSKCVQQHSLFIWVSRVPSPSNPGDAPSRLDVKHLVEAGYNHVDVNWQHVDVISRDV